MSIKINPEFAYPRNNLGNVYHSLGRFEEAIKAYNKALEIDSKYSEPWHGLGNIYLDMHKYDDAINAYKNRIKLKPNSVNSWHGLGNVYSHKNCKDCDIKALEAYKTAIDIDPSFSPAWNGLGNVYQHKEIYDEAITAFKKAIEIDPEFAAARLSLASCYKKLGQDDRYEEQIKIAHDLMENEIEYNRACFESISGNKDNALKLLEIALKKNQMGPDWASKDPDLEAIRDDTRFESLLKKFSSKYSTSTTQLEFVAD